MKIIENFDEDNPNKNRILSSSEGDEELFSDDNVYRLTINGGETVEEVDFTLIKETKSRFKLPFIIYILIFTIILLIASLIALLVIRIKYRENYKYEENIYLKPFISEHNYSRIIFDNKLEVVLTQVHYDDMAGGAIVFETGYLDPIYPPGFLNLAFISLRHNDRDSIENLTNYMGDLQQSSEEFYSSSYFTILNSGFHSYLKNFQNYNSNENQTNISRRHLETLNSLYNRSNLYLIQREKHLIEYLVYDIKDENDLDIWRQGIGKEIEQNLKGNYSAIFNIMDQLFIPSKIKLIFFSHYKMSLMRKYIIRDFQKLINQSNINDNDKDYIINKYDHLNTNKIIYHQIYNNESNYIKINYYINNTNATLSQLYIDSGYFNYLKYILEETNEDSLYFNLTNSTQFNIESLSVKTDIILKSRIKFSLMIRLNHYSYNHIKEIIKIVYDYMDKIRSHINNIKKEDERAKELYKINELNFSYAEDIHVGEYYKNKAKDLFYKDIYEYYLKEVWIPPNLSDENSTDIKYYINKLIPENSIIIIGLSENKIKKYNLNDTNSDISYIFKNVKTTKYLNIIYSVNDLSTIITQNDDKNIDKNFVLKYYKNDYISNYEIKKIYEKNDYISNKKFELINKNEDNNDLLKIYLLRTTYYNMPKVYITLYFFHPFMRPLNNKLTDQFFYIPMIFISYIQREINITLADAKRAGNYFKIYYTENFIYLDILAYSDVVYKITEAIKYIIDTKINNINIEERYCIYRDYSLESLLNFEGDDMKEKLKYIYFEYLTENITELPSIYNFYNFNKTLFELNDSYPQFLHENINLLKPPILHAYILGFYERNDTEKINKLLKNVFSPDHYNAIITTTYNKFLNASYFINSILLKGELKNNYTYTTDLIANNRIYSFLNLADFSNSNRVIVEMLIKSFQFIRNRTNIRIENINQKYIFIRLSFSPNSFQDTSSVINELIDKVEKNEENMTKFLDVVGGRYYYLKNNMDIEFNKDPTNLKECALLYSYRYLNDIENAESYSIDAYNYDTFKKAINKMFENKNYFEFRGKKR